METLMVMMMIMMEIDALPFKILVPSSSWCVGGDGDGGGGYGNGGGGKAPLPGACMDHLPSLAPSLLI
jgi:hypothetical protein